MTQTLPELITPKSYPDQLMRVEYDPYRLMPRTLPPRPYLLATARQVEMARKRIAGGSWHKTVFDHLRRMASDPPPNLESAPITAASMLAQAYHALRNAVVAHVARDTASRERARRTLKLLATVYPDLPLIPDMGRLPAGEDFRDANFIFLTACAYDLLAADGLNRKDDALFRAFLRSTVPASDAGKHIWCGNHHTGVLVGRLAAALALQNRQGIHDVLYGYRVDGQMAYGLIHQLRHDFLADGMHWERTIAYHTSTLYYFVEILDLLLNAGVDLWHKCLPPLWQNDGFDLHRDYGAETGETKSFKAPFEALLYLIFPNGQFSMIGDSNLGAIQGVAKTWGTIFERAWQMYRDPRFAWLIRLAEASAADADRKLLGVPIALQYPAADIGLKMFRVPRTALPQGSFSLKRDARISTAGIHRRGCSHLPCFGATLLRSDPLDAAAPGAMLYWGPHAAGHQAPGALHLEIYAGSIRTPAPRAGAWNFSDPLFPAWHRTTIAHNTVTVDRRPMFPYDCETGSIWEADTWRDWTSESEHVWFRPNAGGFSAMRALNERVYPGVTLDRTVVATRRYILDIFRCFSNRPRTYDWAMHVNGAPMPLAGATPLPALPGKGYDRCSCCRRIPAVRGTVAATWLDDPAFTSVSAHASGRTAAFLCRDPESKFVAVGERRPAGIRHTLILRTSGRDALYVAAWCFERKPPRLVKLSGTAQSEVALTVVAGTRVDAWRIPAAKDADISIS